jgi:hypothetical protein
LILNEESTPGTAGAGTVRIYAKSDKKVYKKDSNGTESELGAGGTSLINYISNPDFETGATTGWATYKDAAATTPANGTGGSPTTLTLSANSSSPMRGSYDFKVAKSAANSQGEGFSYDFTIKTPDKSKKLSISFDLTTNDSNYTAGDVVVYVYDVTNSTLITPSTTSLPKVGASTWNITFDSTTSTSYRLIFHWAVTTATAVNLYFDSFILGPGTITQGAAVSDPVAVTFTGSWVSNTTYTAFEERRGATARYAFKIALSGAPTSTSLTLTLPSGRTINTAAMPDSTTANRVILGNCLAMDGGIDGYPGPVIYESSTQVRLQIIAAASTYADSDNVTQAVPFTFGSGDVITGWFEVPIAEWAGNGTVNLGAGAQVEYASNSGSGGTAANTDYTTGSVAGASQFVAVTSTDVTNAWNTRYVVSFQYPIQATDEVWIEVMDTASGIFTKTPRQAIIGRTFNANSVYGMWLEYRDSTSVWVAFGNAGRFTSGATYASAGATWAGIAASSTYAWRVCKAKPSSPVGFALAASGTSGLINYYQEDDATLASCTFQGNLGGSASAAIAIKITRVGRVVTLDIPALITVVPTTSSTSLNANTALPTWARPAATKSALTISYDNGTYITTVPGQMEVTAAGTIKFYKNLASSAYTNSANAGWYGMQITYTV